MAGTKAKLAKKFEHGFTWKTAAIGLAVVVVAIAALAAIAAFYAPAEQEIQTIRADWTMLAQPAAVETVASNGTELTIYQLSQQSIRPLSILEFQYDAGLGLVKERRTAEVAAGDSWVALTDVGSHIDPTSIAFTDLSDPRAQLLEQDYDYDLVSQQKLLQKYVGKPIAVHVDNRTINGTLLSADWGIVLRTVNGTILTLYNYDSIAYPELPEGLLLKPTISWLVRTALAGRHDMQVSYLTSGLSWSADYIAVANPASTSLDLQGVVSVRNDAGVGFDNARINFVSGDVHIVQAAPTPYPYPVLVREAAGAVSATAPSKTYFTSQGLFEYHLYSLGRLVSLRDGELKQVTLFKAPGVPSKKEYVFEPDVSSSVRVKLVFDNKKENNLGMPLPKGRVRVYQPDGSGQLQFLGEDSVDNTADGETVRVYVGDSLDITGERTQSDYSNLGLCAVQVSYEVKLQNHKNAPVNVVLLENIPGDWTITRESDAHVKESAHVATWDIAVPPSLERTVTYTIVQRYC